MMMPPRFAGYLLPDQRVAVPTAHPQVWLTVVPGTGSMQVRTGELTEEAAPLVPIGHPDAPGQVPPDVADGLRYMRRTLERVVTSHRCPETDPELRAAAARLVDALYGGPDSDTDFLTDNSVTTARDRLAEVLRIVPTATRP